MKTAKQIWESLTPCQQSDLADVCGVPRPIWSHSPGTIATRRALARKGLYLFANEKGGPGPTELGRRVARHAPR